MRDLTTCLEKKNAEAETLRRKVDEAWGKSSYVRRLRDEVAALDRRWRELSAWGRQRVRPGYYAQMLKHKPATDEAEAWLAKMAELEE